MATKHTVSCDSDCPKEFNDIIEKIKSLWPYKIKNFPVLSLFSVELKIHDRRPKSLIIQDNGTVTFKQFKWEKMVKGLVEEEIKEIKISSQEIESLKQYILDNNFFSLKEKYERICFDDCGKAGTIIVTIGDKTHTVYCGFDCPKEFKDIMEKIESLWPYKIEIFPFLV